MCVLDRMASCKLFLLLAHLMFLLYSCSRCVTALTFQEDDDPRHNPHTERLRLAVPQAINRAIARIPREDNAAIRVPFTMRYSEVVSSSRITVSLSYAAACRTRTGRRTRNGAVRASNFRIACLEMLIRMIVLYSNPRGVRPPRFVLAGVRGIEGPVRVEYTVRRIHDELLVRPGPNFISRAPTIVDLSKVQVINNGSLRLHGQSPRHGHILDESFGDYADDDCLIDASYLVSDDWFYGEELGNNEYLESPSEQYHLAMQPDCNLVLYDTLNENFVRFATGTNGMGENCFMLMQLDCNLVVYDGNDQPIWASNTNQGPSDDLGCTLSVDDDGMIRVWMTYTPAIEHDQSWPTSPLWVAGAIALSD